MRSLPDNGSCGSDPAAAQLTEMVLTPDRTIQRQTADSSSNIEQIIQQLLVREADTQFLESQIKPT